MDVLDPGGKRCNWTVCSWVRCSAEIPCSKNVLCLSPQVRFVIFFRTLLQLAEVEHEGGISLHMSPMTGWSSVN